MSLRGTDVNSRLWNVMLALLAVQALTIGMAAAQSRPAIDVAFVHDREVSSWAQGFHDNLRDEVVRVLDIDFDVRTPDELVFTGDGTAASVRAALERALGTGGVELVIASGPLGSREAGLLEERAHPVIGAIILDPDYQGVPMKDGSSGVVNYTYVTTGNILISDLEALARVVDYQQLAVLGSGDYVEALPAEAALPSEFAGVEITKIAGARTVDDILAQVPVDADAVYLLPMTQLTREEIVALIDGFAARDLPVVSFMGEPDVRDGALVGAAPADWPRRVYRRVALAASRIMDGEPVAEIPVSITRDSRLFFNGATATRIGVSPPFEVIIEAVVIGEPLSPGSEEQTLAEVMAQAQAHNRDIAAGEAAVAAGAEQVGVARSVLLPQIGIGLGGSLIDQDSAEFFPTISERTFSGDAGLTQIIWSDRAWANYTIEKHLQDARVGELDQVRLDVGLEAATAYISVLRAQTRLQIQRQNLTFSRTNLERAEVRVNAGQANRSELYRWQSKIAGEQIRVMDAAVVRRLAYFELSRVLFRPFEERLDLVDVTVDDQFKLVIDPRVDRYIEDPASLEILRDFLVEKGLAWSPEVQQFDAAILAAERAHTAATRSFWSPDIGLAGGVDHVISRGGAGSSFDDPLAPGDTTWNLGVFLSLPLFEGGARSAESRRTSQETYRLQRDREGTEQRIEQNVRSATFEVAGSRLAVDLAHNAADAAARNLELVSDQYTLGRVSLVDLIDAQTNALNSNLAVADAVNDYLLDLMRVERAVGRFMFFVSPEVREVWIRELESFAAARR
jgi:outer membrane protein TolC